MAEDKKEVIKKSIVMSLGPHMYMNTPFNEYVDPNRPCIVVNTDILEERVMAKKVKRFANNLPKEANDADFVAVFREYFKKMIPNEKNRTVDNFNKVVDASIEAYCAVFGQNTVGEKIETEVPTK